MKKHLSLVLFLLSLLCFSISCSESNNMNKNDYSEKVQTLLNNITVGMDKEEVLKQLKDFEYEYITKENFARELGEQAEDDKEFYSKIIAIYNPKTINLLYKKSELIIIGFNEQLKVIKVRCKIGYTGP